MTIKKLQQTLLVLMLIFYTTVSSYAQHSGNEIKVIGAMRNVMWKGQLYGTIHLDTLSDKQNLYGLGPVEFLSGELLIIDGKSYRSSVLSETEMKVEETYDVKAPFFVYTTVAGWDERSLPDSIHSGKDLESYLHQFSQDVKRPFAFMLSGTVDTATIHVVNLPGGSTVTSPGEAHQGQKNYDLHNEQATILGFFSTEHKAVFTHHDSFVHMHLITTDKKKMGHLDKVKFKKGAMKLYLPAYKK
ncbi:MAG TPA: acetolactate decarboxylase [Flavisolibacter sp.]|nr:acetolactate decarboxylase [Flavisolibacter sp.]